MKNYKSLLNQLTLKREISHYQNVKITSSKDSDEFLRQFFFDDLTIYESFFLILLNRANITTGYVKISHGGVAGTVVDVKMIAKYAIESLAESVILCHNHPTGNTQPSNADINMTKKIKKTLSLFDVNVLDHIILAENSYYSFADEGKL